MRIRFWWVFALVLLAALYAWQIEPFWIHVTRHSVPAGLSSPVKLMVLSDLHTRGFGRLERGVLRIIDREKPDLIVVVGHCFTPHPNHQAVGEFLGKLKAPLGVWVVRGNWEHWRPVPDEVNFYGRAGVRLLVNSNAAPRSDLSVIGLDDPWVGTPNLTLAEKGAKGYRIALFHSPAYFDKIAGRFPLNLAGHTHGGQIRLPFIGPLWLPGGCGRYEAGWYGNAGSRLYVTRGVGTSVLPMRFLCRPEIPVLELRSQKNNVSNPRA